MVGSRFRHDPEAAGTGSAAGVEQHQQRRLIPVPMISASPASGHRRDLRRLSPGSGPRAEIGAGVLRERRAKINRVIDAAQNDRIDHGGFGKIDEPRMAQPGKGARWFAGTVMPSRVHEKANGQPLAGPLSPMGAVLRLSAHEFSARWRSWAVLVLLVALTGGAVLTAAAGARRTSSAYPQFLRISKAADVLVSPDNTGLDSYYPGAWPAARRGRAGADRGPQCVAAWTGRQASVQRTGGCASRWPVRAPARDPQAALRAPAPAGPPRRSRCRPDRGTESSPARRQQARAWRHRKSWPRSDPAPGRAGRRRHVVRGSVVPVTTCGQARRSSWPAPLLLHQLGPGYRAFDGAYVRLRPGRYPGELRPPGAGARADIGVGYRGPGVLRR